MTIFLKRLTFNQKIILIMFKNFRNSYKKKDCLNILAVFLHVFLLRVDFYLRAFFMAEIIFNPRSFTSSSVHDNLIKQEIFRPIK